MMLHFLKWFGDRMYIFVLEGCRIRDHLRKHGKWGWQQPVRERITTRGLIIDEKLRKRAFPFPDHPIQQILYECGYTSVRFNQKEVGRLLNGFILQVDTEAEAIWFKMKQDILYGLKITEIYKFKNFEYLEKQDKRLKEIEQQLFLLDRLVRMQEEADNINDEADTKYVGLLSSNIRHAIKNISKAKFDCHPLYAERKRIKKSIKYYLKRRLVA